MHKANIKIKNYTNSIDLTYNHILRMKIMHGMLAGLCIFILMYLFFIGFMIYNVLERNSFEDRVRALSTEVSELEVAYINASDKIDLEYSYSLGFGQIEKHFATRALLSMQ